jgi:hypothetical protein
MYSKGSRLKVSALGWRFEVGGKIKQALGKSISDCGIRIVDCGIKILKNKGQGFEV